MIKCMERSGYVQHVKSVATVDSKDTKNVQFIHIPSSTLEARIEKFLTACAFLTTEGTWPFAGSGYGGGAGSGTFAGIAEEHGFGETR